MIYLFINVYILSIILKTGDFNNNLQLVVPDYGQKTQSLSRRVRDLEKEKGFRGVIWAQVHEPGGRVGILSWRGCGLMLGCSPSCQFWDGWEIRNQGRRAKKEKKRKVYNAFFIFRYTYLHT